SFLLSDGRTTVRPTVPVVRTLRQAAEAYREALAIGAVEKATLECVAIHIDHLARVLGGKTQLCDLEAGHLQEYVARRSREPGRRGRTITPTTIKKELSTLGAIWTWTRQMGFLDKSFPRRGLRFPKTTDQSAFQTFQQIHRQIERRKLTPAEEAD